MSDKKEEEKLQDEHRFNEQCFLMDNCQQLSWTNAQKTEYKTFLMVDGDPGTVVHSLATKYGVNELLNITPSQVALMMPKIQLHKVIYKDEKDGKGEDVEIPFRDHTSATTIENMTKNGLGRGDDVGLRSFSYTFAGKNLAEEGTTQCNLKIFFQNINSLLEKRGKFSYVDLILFTPPKDDKKENNVGEDNSFWEEYNSKSYRIKAEAGWAIPQDPKNTLFNGELKKAIENTKTTLFLTLKQHDIDFREDGSLELSADYVGAMEGLLSSTRADLLSPSILGKWAQKKRKDREKVDKSKTSASTNPSDVPVINASNKDDVSEIDLQKLEDGNKDEKEKLNISILEAADKQVRYSRFINELYESERMYFTNISPSHIETFNQEQTERFQKIMDAGKLKTEDFKLEKQRRVAQNRRKKKIEIYQLTKEYRGKAKEEILNAVKKPNEIEASMESKHWYTPRDLKLVVKNKNEKDKQLSGPDTQTSTGDPDCPEKVCKKIYFMFFGDLVEVALKTLDLLKDPDALNLKVLLGPIDVVLDPLDPKAKPVRMNLADIPISLNLFVTWYLRDVVAQQRPKYYLRNFLEDVLEKLIIPSLGEDCLGGVERPNMNLRMDFITLPNKNLGELGSRIPARKLEDISKKSTSISDSKDLMHILFIYVNSIVKGQLHGDYAEDYKRGIYHLYFGSDRGLVKSIKFSKANQPFVQEYRATSDSSASKRMQNRYNARVRMIGNTIFRLGQYVFIDTSRYAFGDSSKKNSISYRLGLGGYFEVIKMEYIVDDKTYETELELRWISSGAPEEAKADTLKIAAKLAQKSNAQVNVGYAEGMNKIEDKESVQQLKNNIWKAHDLASVVPKD